MTTKTRDPISTHIREFCVPEDFRDRTFFDAFADAFTPPEDLPLHQTDYGFLARIRDGHRIREDFRKAVNLEKQKQKSRTTAVD